MGRTGPISMARFDFAELAIEASVKCCSTLANACRNLVDKQLGTDPHQFDLYVGEVNHWVDGLVIPNERQRKIHAVLNIGDQDFRSESSDHKTTYRRFRDVELPAAVEFWKAIKG